MTLQKTTPQNVTLASNADDLRAIETIESHHAALSGALALRVDALLRSARHGDDDGFVTARDELARWCRGELEPHALAEEASLYRAAGERAAATLLVRAMSHEHGLLTSLVAAIGTGTDPVGVAADATALRALFESHVAKENELLLPLLAGDPDVSLAGLLDEMHEGIDANAPATEEGTPADGAAGQEAHSCGCHEAEGAGHPELDARRVPHAIRHATVFGALDGLAPGEAMVLVAPHDPLPLLAQIEDRSPGAFGVSYLERGPEDWRLLFQRRAV